MLLAERFPVAAAIVARVSFSFLFKKEAENPVKIKKTKSLEVTHQNWPYLRTGCACLKMSIEIATAAGP